MSQEAPDTASAVARRLFSALADGQWSDAAACIDPADMQLQYDSALQIADQHKRHLEIGVDQEGASHSATGEMGQRARSGHARLPFPWSVLGVVSVDELRALSASELMARVLEIKESRLLDDQRGGAMGLGLAQLELDRPGPVSQLLRVVLGEMQETDDTTHVVFRRLLKEAGNVYLVEPVGCVTLRRLPSGWRVALSDVAGTKSTGRAQGSQPWSALSGLRFACV